MRTTARANLAWTAPRSRPGSSLSRRSPLMRSGWEGALTGRARRRRVKAPSHPERMSGERRDKDEPGRDLGAVHARFARAVVLIYLGAAAAAVTWFVATLIAD